MLWPGPHAFCPKLTPFVDVLSRFMTVIQSVTESNLRLTRFVALILLNDLLYNAFVFWGCINVSRIFEQTFPDGEDSSSVLDSFCRAQKMVPTRNFIADVNKAIQSDGSPLLIP